MNILVTGANGLLGKSLLEKLSIEHKIFAVVGKNSVLRCKKNITVLRIDLSNLDIDKLPSNIDVIYYLAQSNHFREFPDKATDMLSINVYTPVTLASWGKENGVKKFIYTSSGGVYKSPTKPVQEIFDINANEKNGFYLDSKLCAEILLRNFADFFETFVIVRPFFMYGPEQNRGMLIPRLMDNIINENEIILTFDKGIKINPIFIDDAASAMEKLLTLEGEHIFNLAGSQIVSLGELSDLIGEVVDKTPVYKVLENTQPNLVADISKMKEKLCTPKVTLKEGLKALYHGAKK